MKRHYPLVITACCFLFLFVNVGFPSTSFSVYQPYLVEQVGHAGGALILSVRTFVTLVTTFFASVYFTRLDCRVGIAIGCLLNALGFFCYGIAGSLPLYLLGSVFSGAGYSFGGLVGMTLLTGRWYKERVGTAVGVATVGSGVAGMALPPLVTQVVHSASLSAAFLMEAAMALVIGVVVFALIRNYPNDIGAQPFGAHAAQDAEGAGSGGADASAQGTESALDEVQVLPARVRMLLVAAMGCVGMVCVGAMAYLSVLMTTNGFAPAFVAAALALSGASLTVFKFVTGELFDKFGTMRGTVLIFAMSISGLVLCLFMPLGNQGLALAACVLFGAGVTTGSVGISVWGLDLSTPETRTRTVRNFQVGYSVGGFIGDTFPGFLAEACGSYVPTYGIILATTVFAGATVIWVYKKYRSA